MNYYANITIHTYGIATRFTPAVLRKTKSRELLKQASQFNITI